LFLNDEVNGLSCFEIGESILIGSNNITVFPLDLITNLLISSPQLNTFRTSAEPGSQLNSKRCGRLGGNDFS